jgi:transposase-like protein
MDTDPTTHKLCTGAHGCNEVKLRSHFTNDKSKKDGKRNRCKQCQRDFNKKFPSGRRASDKKYRNKPEVRFKKYKASAESRGYTWDLTRDQFMVHWQKPCNHCGAAIETIGLDRVDSSLPYQVDNVEPCCSKCNQMKSDWSTVDWYTHMGKIMSHKMTKV